MITTLQPPRTIYDVWQGLPEGTNCQLINNSLIKSPSPSDIHQVVLNKINNKFFTFLDNHPIGEIRIAPYDVHFSRENIFQPDLIFISKENLKFITPEGLAGVPDLVIEVLSPGSAVMDAGKKKKIYEQYGVKEYYLVEPAAKKVQPFILRDKVFVTSKETSGVIISELLKTSISF